MPKKILQKKNNETSSTDQLEEIIQILKKILKVLTETKSPFKE